MANGKMEEDGDGFWMKCMVVKIRQKDPDNYYYDKHKDQPTKRQAMKRDPRAYLGNGDSKFEQLNFMVEHAVDYRWESGWGANQALIRNAAEGCAQSRRTRDGP